MAPKLAPGMNPLGCLSDDEEEESGSDRSTGAPPARPTAPAKAEVDYQALQRAGYKGGPSVLYIPEARAEGQQASWNWSQGRQGAGDAAPESAAERAATAHAVGAGVNEQIEQQLLFAEHAKRLREEAREEALEMRGGRGRGGRARVCLPIRCVRA